MKEFNILIEELDKISEKWQQRLKYQSEKVKISMIASYALLLCMRLSGRSRPQIDELPKKDKKNLTS